MAASSRWAAKPMDDAGLGSIVRLQWARTPARVHALLVGWASKHMSRIPPNELNAARRSLYRDIVGYIPAFVAAFITALYFWQFVATDAQLLGAFKIDIPQEFSSRPWLWVVAPPLLCGFFDLVEDVLHLSYMKRYDVAPSWPRVVLATICTGAKCLLFLPLALLFAAAAVFLAWSVIAFAAGNLASVCSWFDFAKGWAPPAAKYTLPLIAHLLLAAVMLGTTFAAFRPLWTRRD
jgi:hypothetical protein